MPGGMSKMRIYVEHERAYKSHRQRMVDAKAMTDNSTPKERIHLQLRLKQLQIQEERLAIIDRDNKIMLKKMTEIMRSTDNPSRRSKNDDWKGHSLNTEYRNRERCKILVENFGIAHRIERARPVYKVDRWEKDYIKQKNIADSWRKHQKKYRIYALPEDEEKPRRGPKGEASGDDQYDSDFESSSSGSHSGTDDDEKDRKKRKGGKLPPIKAGHGKGNGSHRSRDGSSEGRQTPDSQRGRKGRKWEYASPDPNLWMYYGIRPNYSDEDDDETSPRRKKKGNDDKADKQAESDARQLFRVAKELAPPHAIIIRTLAKKTFAQRMKTKEKFSEMYDLDMETELKRGLGGEWSLLVECLLNDQNEGQSEGVCKSMKSGDPVALVKKLTPLSNQEVADLKEQYYKENSSNLHSDITKKFQKPTETLLLTLVKGKKKEQDKVNEKAAEKDAKALFEFGSGRWTSNKGKFIRLVEDRTPAHMACVFAHFKALNKGKPASKSVQEECTRDYAQVVNAYVSATESAGSETADNLHRNLDATNPVFVKTVVARSETDIDKVRKEYKKKYGNEMVSDLEQRCDHVTVPVLKVIIEKTPKGGKGKKGDKTQRDEEEDEEDSFDPEDDAERLHDAMEGLGTKEKVIIDIIPVRTNAQRQEIKEKYQERYKKDLNKALESELSGDFRDAILGLMMPPVQYDAHCLKHSTKGLGTDETTLIGIICSKDDGQMAEIKSAYKDAYKTDLAADVKDDTSGDFGALLLKLIADEDKDSKVDKAKAEKDAKALNGKPTDDLFANIFIHSTDAQLEATVDAYKKLTKKDITEVIIKKTKGDLRDGYLARVKAQSDMTTFYAERLRDSMKGMGTNEAQLTRILVSTSEGELPAISSKYHQMYKTTLKKDIESDTSGDYRKTLLKLLAKHGKKAKGDGKKDGKEEHGKEGHGKEGRKGSRGRSRSGSKERDEKRKEKEREKEMEEQRKKEAEEEQKRKEKEEKEKEKAEAEKKKKEEEEKKKEKEEGDENEDAVRLYKAMKGLGTDEDVIVDILPCRTNEERQEIKARYQELYDKELEKELKSETSGEFQEVIMALLVPSDQYEADCLEDAMKGKGTDETALIGLICSKTQEELDIMRDTYKKRTNKDLSEVIEKETKGDFKDVLLEVLKGQRDKSTKVNQKKAEEDAEAIGNKHRLSTIKELYSTGSSAQIKATEAAHMKMYNFDIRESIKGACSGDEEKLYLALANSQGDPTDFYVGRLYNSMKGIGTNDSQLIRILVSRSEIDLPEIKAKYEKQYGTPLAKDVEGDTSGDYKKILLKLIGNAGKGGGKKGDKKGEEKGQGKGAQKGGESPRKKEGVAPKDTKRSDDRPPQRGAPVGKEGGDKAKKDAGKKDDKGKGGKEEEEKEEDATRLYNAMKGFGTDESVIIDIIPCRTNAERQEIKKRYKELYKQDLEKELKSELSGDFQETILALMVPSDQYGADCLDDAMKGRGADETALIGIVCSKTPEELNELKESYKKSTKKDLAEVLAKETKGDFKDVILEVLSGQRDTSTEADEQKAEEDAEAIGNKHRLSTIKELYSKGSAAQIKATETAHMRMYKFDIRESIKGACSGDEEKLYLALANSQGDVTDFYVDRIYNSMKGFGTNDSQLIRILVSRSEVDLPELKKKYEKKYGSPLRKDVASETSGDYKKTLLKIIDKAGKGGGKKDDKKNKKDDKKDDAHKSEKKKDDSKKTETVKKQRTESPVRGAPPPKKDEGKGKKQEKDEGKKKRDDSPKRSPHRDSEKGKKDEGKKKRDESPKRSPHRDSEKGKKKRDESPKRSPRDTDKGKKDDGKKKEGDDKKKQKDKKDEKKGKGEEEEDATRLYKAMKGLGTDEDVIINIIPCRTNAERQQIKKRYKELYKQDLDKELKSETSGDFQETLMALMTPSDQFAESMKDVTKEADAQDNASDFYVARLHDSMKGLGTKDTQLINILVLRSEVDLAELKSKYEKTYGTSLKKDVEDDTSGDYRKTLLKLIDNAGKGGGKGGGKGAKKSESPTRKKEASPVRGAAAKDSSKTSPRRDGNKKKQEEQRKKKEEEEKKKEEEERKKREEEKKKQEEERRKRAAAAAAAATAKKQAEEYRKKKEEDERKKKEEEEKQKAQEKKKQDEDRRKRAAEAKKREDEKKKAEAEKKAKEEEEKKKKEEEDKKKKEAEKKKQEEAKKKKEEEDKKREEEKKKKEEEEKKKQEAKAKADEEAKKKKEEEDKKKKEEEEKKKKAQEEEKKKKEEEEKKKKEEEEKKKKEQDDKKKAEEEQKKKEASKTSAKPADENEDAARLYKAMKGMGTDEDVIIEIIPCRTNAQRQDLKTRYTELYQKDLEKELESELSGDMKEVILALMVPSDQYEVRCLEDAMKGWGTDETALIGILCSKTSAEIAVLKEDYKKAYKKDLDKEVEKETSKNFQATLLQILSGQRDQGDAVDLQKAETDAEAIGNNHNLDAIRELYTKANPAQIKATEEAHQRLYKFELRESVKQATSGDAEKAYLCLADAVSARSDMTVFWAQRLHGSMEGKGTNDSQLIRILVGHSETDLPAIKEKYEVLYGVSLRADVEKETSGDYRKVLLKILGEAKEGDTVSRHSKSAGSKKGGPPKSAGSRKGGSRRASRSSGRKDSIKEDDEDAVKLFKAMKGFGTNEQGIINILPYRTNAERQNIKKRYKELYNMELEAAFKSELSGDLRETVLALMMTPQDYEAFCLHEALAGPGRDASALIGIIATKTPPEMAELRGNYRKMYNRELDTDIGKETSGEFGKLITELAAGLKPSKDVDHAKAEADAKEIHDEPSEKCFNRVFTENSRLQMAATAFAHERLFNQDISESLKRSSSEDAETTYLALVDSFRDESEFYAKRLMRAMKGLGTNDSQLIRILVSRSEMDLPDIKTKYQELYGQPLSKEVESETSGDYQDLLLKLIDQADKLAKEGAKGKAKRAQTPKTPGDGKKAEDLAIKLFRCMESAGTDEEGIVNILTGQPNRERQKIKAKYYELYKKDLVADLEKELSGEVKETVVALMMPPVEYDAFCLHEALKGLGTDDTTLIGMLTSKKAQELDEIKATYKKMYKQDLEEGIKGDTSGDYQEMLLELASGQRDQTFRVDKDKADKDAKLVHDDPSTPNFKQVFVKSSRTHVKAVAEAHQKLFRTDITESIAPVTMGNMKETYTSIVKSCSDETEFYAERLHHAIYGLGTNDTLLIRLVVSKSETNLNNIQVKYNNMYKQSLRSAIEADVSGHYKTALLRLLDK